MDAFGALRPASSLWRAARRTPAGVTGCSTAARGEKGVWSSYPLAALLSLPLPERYPL
jgi:hypothetical protein